MNKDHWIKVIVETLLKPIEFSGEHRKEQWEKGWGQNLQEQNPIPHYFGKYPVVRKNGEFIDAPPGFEYQELCNLQRDVFGKYLKDATRVVEFGCGTGHNLQRVREVNPFTNIMGTDWAQSGVENVKRLGFVGYQFDMFNPSDLDIRDVSIFTMASMEQLGTKFEPFIDYVVKGKPKICVHMEPINELMDPENLLDYLQLEYMKKRNYLNGLLTYLRELEKRGIITILEASRNGVGSLFIEGYSVIAWRPL